MFKLIYKKSNESSFLAIKKYQKENNIKKIGHTGTLDLLACGLLLVATEDDTKLIPFIQNKDKEYYVKFKLGFVSKTYDSEGPIFFQSDYQPKKEQIIKTINAFIGKIQQIPPNFSAKKINGTRAYKLARKNHNFSINPINVVIYSIYDIEYEYPNVEFKVLVSNGTYIRTLIHDIGQSLKTGAYITYLERIMISGIKTDKEIDLKKLLNCYELNLEKSDLKNILNGKFNVFKNLIDGNYLINYKNETVGFISIENQIKIKQKIFGNKILKLVNLND